MIWCVMAEGSGLTNSGANRRPKTHNETFGYTNDAKQTVYSLSGATRMPQPNSR